MSRGATAHVTRNFERNLEDLRRYLEEHAAHDAFDRLLTDLFGSIVPSLESFPLLGVDFLARRPRSTEGSARISALRSRLGEEASLREYIAGDYLVLYAVMGSRLYLLSIRHHRQLSFDLRGHWSR